MSPPNGIPEEERTIRFNPVDLPVLDGEGDSVDTLDTERTEISIYQPSAANPALAEDIIYYSDTDPLAELPGESTTVEELPAAITAAKPAEESPTEFFSAPPVEFAAEAAPVEPAPVEEVAVTGEGEPAPIVPEEAPVEFAAEAAPVEPAPMEEMAATSEGEPAPTTTEEAPVEFAAEAAPAEPAPVEEVAVTGEGEPAPVATAEAPVEFAAEATPAVSPPAEPAGIEGEVLPAAAGQTPSALSAEQSAWSEIVNRQVGVPADSVPTRVAYVDTWEEIVHRSGAAAHAEPPRLDAVPLGIPVAQPEPAERVPVPEILLPPSPEQETWGEIVRREPGIPADAVRPLAPADLASSPAYVEMGSRLGQSAEIVDRYSPDRLRFLARDLTAALEASLKAGKLDGLMVATDDGLVIAESRRMDRGEVLAAISTLCESIATRLQRESLVESIEEMSIRGERGEQIIVRYFPGLGQRYFLLGFSRRHVPYRRAMTVTVRRCSELLHQHFPGLGPADKPNPEEST